MLHNWVEYKPRQPLPPFAVIGGHDYDGSPIYVGRSHHEGNILPAKVVVPTKTNAYAYVSWDGLEIRKTNFEILCGSYNKWNSCTTFANYSIPSNAVPAGNTASGEQLFIGRGLWEGTLTVGRIHPSHRCLYIPFDGKEEHLDSYEILTCESSNRFQFGCTFFRFLECYFALK